MLLLVPRGLPRTALAIARLAIVAVLLRPDPPPPLDFDFGYIGKDGVMEQWPGPNTPYQFVMRRGGREVHVVYIGPDPKLRYDEEFGIAGHMVGGEFIASKIIVLCDWRDRECFVRHPEQRRGRHLPDDYEPYP